LANTGGLGHVLYQYNENDANLKYINSYKEFINFKKLVQ